MKKRLPFTHPILLKVVVVLHLSLASGSLLWSQNSIDSVAYYAERIKRELHVDNESYLNEVQKLLKHSKNYGRQDGTAEAYHALGIYYEEQSLYDSALHYQQLALDYWLSVPLPEKVAYSYNALSVVYKDLGDCERAIDYSLKGLRLADSLIITKLRVYCRTNMGECYLNIGNQGIAAEYFKEAKKIAVEADNEEYLAIALIYIGNTQLNAGKLDSAESNYNEFLRIKNVHSDFDGVAAALSNLGAIEFFRGDLYAAIRKYRQSITAAQRVNNVYQQVISICNVAEAHMELGNFPQAHSYLDTAISLAQANESNRLLALSHQLLATLYEKQRQPENALNAYHEYSSYNDKMINEERARQIANMEVRYQSERKEKQIVQQKLHIQQQEAAIFLKDAQVLSLIASLFILILFGSIFYNRYKARQNSILQKVIIQEQERGLNAVLLATEEERKRIAKDLHDGIGQQLSGLKMAWQKLANDFLNKVPEESKRIDRLTGILDNSASEVRNISHQMMPKALLDLGLVAAVGDMLEKVFTYTGIQHSFEHYQAERRFDERVEISLYRILQELINNIIKHSGATRVSVQLFVNKAKLIMVVEDNGKGFPNDASSSGHGLMNIRSRLSTLQGKVNYDPSPGAGTVATVTIPLANE